jgi:hypothetical protein
MSVFVIMEDIGKIKEALLLLLPSKSHPIHRIDIFSDTKM